MPVQLIRKVCDKQPTKRVRIDWSNPITKGLYFAFDTNLNAEFITGKSGKYSQSQRVTTKFGIARNTIASNEIFTSLKIPALPISAIVLTKCVNWDGAPQKYIQHGLGGTSGYEFNLTSSRLNVVHYGVAAYQATADSWNGSSVDDSAVKIIGFTDNGTDVKFYDRGAQLGLPVSVGTFISGDQSLKLFESVGSNSLSRECFIFAWNRALSPVEHLSLSQNPWQIFEPETIPLFYSTGIGPVTHPTSGDVVGTTATVTGSALRETTVQTHPSTGDVVGNTATINGTALRYRAHATTGTVTGLTSNVTGTAKRYRLHTTTGAVTGLTSTVTGSATIQPAPGIHVTSGDIVAGVGTVSGTALHIGVHTTTGVLAGFSAEVVGAAQRSGAVIVHGTSGVLAGYDSVVTGAATNQGSMTLTPADIQAIVAAIKAEIMPVNIVRVNNIDVDGTGADSDPWGPV